MKAVQHPPVWQVQIYITRPGMIPPNPFDLPASSPNKETAFKEAQRRIDRLLGDRKIYGIEERISLGGRMTTILDEFRNGAFVAQANRYVSEEEPWALAEHAAQTPGPDEASVFRAKLHGCLFSLAAALQTIAQVAAPLLPDASLRLARSLVRVAATTTPRRRAPWPDAGLQPASPYSRRQEILETGQECLLRSVSDETARRGQCREWGGSGRGGAHYGFWP